MSNTSEAVAALGTVDLFAGLTKKELLAVYMQAKEQTFAPGKVVVSEGQQGGRFYLLLEGEVEVSIGGRKRAVRTTGDYFGEIALLDGQPRSATVTALSPLRVLTLTSWNFRPFLLEHPAVMYKVLVETCSRLRAAES
jgi:CRP/FNR family cyclic AMP-dependent transcriptional regulator